MVGDWIKMRTDLYRDPKVCVMADILLNEKGELALHVRQNCMRNMTVTRNVMRNVIVGSLVTVWGTVRHRGKRSGDNLIITGVTTSVIDDIADLPGLGEAMAHVGWAVQDDKCLIFPGFFDEYNSEPTPEPKTNAERQRAWRERNKQTQNATVTKSNESNAREEKRREEKSREDKGPEPQPEPERPSVPSLEGFSDSDKAKAFEIFERRWFDLKGCLPNYERQDVKQELREIADKIHSRPDGYEKLKAYFAQPPPPELGRTCKLWQIFRHLFEEDSHARRWRRDAGASPDMSAGGGRRENLKLRINTG